MNVKSVEIVPIGGSGNIGLQVQYTDAAAVEELTSKLRWRDDKTLSYGWYDDPLVSAQITSTVTEDTLLFTQFPMLGADSIDEQYRYILELIAYNLQAERTRAYTYSADYKFNSDSAHFGLSRLTAEDEEIIRYIQENYPEFEVWTDDERSKYLYVSMKAEIGPKFYYAWKMFRLRKSGRMRSRAAPNLRPFSFRKVWKKLEIRLLRGAKISAASFSLTIWFKLGQRHFRIAKL